MHWKESTRYRWGSFPSYDLTQYRIQGDRIKYNSYKQQKKNPAAHTIQNHQFRVWAKAWQNANKWKYSIPHFYYMFLYIHPSTTVLIYTETRQWLPHIVHVASKGSGESLFLLRSVHRAVRVSSGGGLFFFVETMYGRVAVVVVE